MTTIAEAIDAALDANWSGAGGAEPTISNTQDVLGMYFPATDYIMVLGYSLKTDMRRVNDTYAHKTHTIDLECSTSDATNTEDRLNEIVEEVERILSTDGVVTGYDTVRVTRVDRRITPQDRHVYKALVTVELHEFLAASATAAGSASSYNLGAALMLGSANAAWVPCVFELESVPGKIESSTGITLRNVDATDLILIWRMPLPTIKGTLKLYINGIHAGLYDADATNFITQMTIFGLTHSSFTSVKDYTTNYQSQGNCENLFTAEDCSTYDSILLKIQWFCTDAGAIDMTYANLRCYYDV